MFVNWTKSPKSLCLVWNEVQYTNEHNEITNN